MQRNTGGLFVGRGHALLNELLNVEKLLRGLSLLSAVINAVAAVAFGVMQGSPLGLESALSFAIGASALVVFLEPDVALRLAGALSKAVFAIVVGALFMSERVHPLFLVAVIADAIYVVVFFRSPGEDASPLLPAPHGDLARQTR